ncbi:MAG: hypothetical protein QCH99_11120 [Candidatus Bathyarchaeota archaeon]|nr:hypothetical protein [Candidatus Bathyarchaeum tardum]
MNKIKSSTITFLLISLLFFNFGCAIGIAESDGPSWLKKGTFVTYSIEPTIVRFANGSIRNTKSDTSVIYSWKCVEIRNNLAEIKVTLDYETEQSTINMSKIVYIDVLTREVFFSNGTLIGSSWLWVQPYPVQDECFVLLNTSQNELVGYVDGAGDRPMYYDTQIQEFQKAFLLAVNGTLDGKDIASLALIFDFNTGILLSGSPTVSEPTFVALGIKNFLLSQLFLVNTNIDLGPAELSFKIREALPYVALISAFILITISIYFKNKKKKVKNN